MKGTHSFVYNIPLKTVCASPEAKISKIDQQEDPHDNQKVPHFEFLGKLNIEFVYTSVHTADKPSS